MDLQLQNKIALVTGSTAGIGETIAKRSPKKERALSSMAGKRTQLSASPQRFSKDGGKQKVFSVILPMTNRPPTSLKPQRTPSVTSIF
jgi:NADP-dependent 3-hydroxy acid dehydrogenase YdfG